MNATRNSTEKLTSVQWRPYRQLRRDLRRSTESASTHLAIARLLLDYGRTEVARRRLKRVVEKFGNTPAAAESRDLLAAMGAATGDGDAADSNSALKSG